MQRKQIDRVVNETAIPLIAELGTASLSIGDVLGLNIGDTIVLDQEHDQPMSVKLRGQHKLTARPGNIGRRYGLVVEDVVKPGEYGQTFMSKPRLGARQIPAGQSPAEVTEGAENG